MVIILYRLESYVFIYFKKDGDNMKGRIRKKSLIASIINFIKNTWPIWVLILMILFGVIWIGII